MKELLEKYKIDLKKQSELNRIDIIIQNKLKNLEALNVNSDNLVKEIFELTELKNFLVKVFYYTYIKISEV